MPPESGLPKRNAGGYQITAIVLEVTAGRKLAERIVREVPMPAPPNGTINEVQLAALLRTLVGPASEALNILQKNEGDRARNDYAQPQYERVQIRVLSGGRLVGRVTGAGQTYNPRGQMTSPGARVVVDTTPVNRRRKGGDPGSTNRKS